MMKNTNDWFSLEEEIRDLQKCCSQRGARMQMMQNWLRSTGNWKAFSAFYHGTPDMWFDEDGVPKHKRTQETR